MLILRRLLEVTEREFEGKMRENRRKSMEPLKEQILKADVHTFE